MAQPSELETGKLVGGDGKELDRPVLNAPIPHVAWKILVVSMATLGVAIIGRSAGTWAAAEVGSHSLLEIMPTALQRKNEEVCYATSELQDECTGWGDPHFEKRFHNLERTDNYQMGVYALAKSTDGNFELQGFQCQSGEFRTTFGAFAIQINGKITSYIGTDTMDFQWHDAQWKNAQQPDGLNITGNPSGPKGTTIKSPNLCQTLWIKKVVAHGGVLPYYLDFAVSMSSAASDGICGTHTVSQVLPTKRLFSKTEMQSICNMCKMEHNCEGFHPEMPTPDVANLCHKKGIEWADAVKACKDSRVLETFRKGCVFDYCATGGDSAAVENAAAESAHYQVPH